MEDVKERGKEKTGIRRTSDVSILVLMEDVKEHIHRYRLFVSRSIVSILVLMEDVKEQKLKIYLQH